MYVHCMVYRGQTVAILIHLQSVGHPSIMVFNHLSSVPSDVYQDEDEYCDGVYAYRRQQTISVVSGRVIISCSIMMACYCSCRGSSAAASSVGSSWPALPAPSVASSRGGGPMLMMMMGCRSYAAL